MNLSEVFAELTHVVCRVVLGKKYGVGEGGLFQKYGLGKELTHVAM